MVFDLSNTSNYRNLRVTFFAKGIQTESCGASSFVNFISGQNRSTKYLSSSPVDGGYGIQTVTIKNSPFTDKVAIVTANCGSGDKDDWEFTGLYVEGY